MPRYSLSRARAAMESRRAGNHAVPPSNATGTEEIVPSIPAGSQAAGPSNPAGAFNAPNQADAPSNGAGTQEVVVSGNQADALSNAAGSQAAGPSNAARAVGRFSGQLENVSSRYWDCEYDDGGKKPSDLYGAYSYEIEKFSTLIELMSVPFEIGGNLWQIEMARRSDHHALRLAVIIPLVPGSLFGQVTVTLLDKDIARSKRLDAFHQFSKNAPCISWKTFLAISNPSEFIDDADTLRIRVQIQVIRERVDRPFRCLDAQYGKELLQVHSTSAEFFCQKVVEELMSDLVQVVEDNSQWLSFCDFWVAMDHKSKLLMTCEKEPLLKVIVKQFFRKEEVTTPLLMDSLFNGLKALEGNKGRGIHFVRIEKGKLALVNDPLETFEESANQPLPQFIEDSLESRLTELGCWTIEMFVVTHIFSKIQAFKKQEDLIREEEEEEAARRRDKEKKAKKNQGKKNKRKEKKKGHEEPITEPQIIHEVHSPVEANSSGLSGVQGMERGSPSVVDDSSSTQPSDPDNSPSSVVQKIISPSDVLSSLKELPMADKHSIPHEVVPSIPAGSQAAGPSNPAGAVNAPFYDSGNQADAPSNAVGTKEVVLSNVAGNQADVLSNAAGSQAAGSSNAARAVVRPAVASTQLFPPLVSQPEIRPGPTFFQSSPSLEEYPFMDLIHELLNDEPGPQIRP